MDRPLPSVALTQKVRWGGGGVGEVGGLSTTVKRSGRHSVIIMRPLDKVLGVKLGIIGLCLQVANFFPAFFPLFLLKYEKKKHR